MNAILLGLEYGDCEGYCFINRCVFRYAHLLIRVTDCQLLPHLPCLMLSLNGLYIAQKFLIAIITHMDYGENLKIVNHN